MTLQKLCEQIARGIAVALPKGARFILFLLDTRPGASPNLASGSNVERDEAVRAVYDWLESLGTRGTGVPVAKAMREAIVILTAAEGRGLTAGALTPARALAMGMHAAFIFQNRGPGTPAVFIDSAKKAIALLQVMIAAEPVAEAELAAERAQGGS